VTEALEAFEGKLIDQQSSVERAAEKLFEAGEAELARAVLTYYSGTEARAIRDSAAQRRRRPDSLTLSVGAL
jgi:hypothetical protein